MLQGLNCFQIYHKVFVLLIKWSSKFLLAILKDDSAKIVQQNWIQLFDAQFFSPLLEWRLRFDQPRTQRPRCPWPAVEKRATLEKSDLKSEISDFRLNCACLADKNVAQSGRWCLLPLIFIIFKTNQNRACNGILEERSFFSSLCSKERRLEERDWDSTWKISDDVALWDSRGVSDWTERYSTSVVFFGSNFGLR